MSNIRVLGLDDDNHSEEFCTLGAYFSGDALLEELAKPHTVSYSIRHIHLIDFEDRDLTLGDTTMSIDCWWNLLSCVSNPKELFMKDEARWKLRELAFDYFWNNYKGDYDNA